MLYPSIASKRPTPSARSLSDFDSEDDAYGESRNRTFTMNNGQQQHGEVRFSTRRAAKVSNYNEDDEDPFDDDENILTPGYWVTAPDEDTPAIDAVLKHRLREDRSELCLIVKPRAQTYPSTGTEITIPAKEDFEYKVSGSFTLITPTISGSFC